MRPSPCLSGLGRVLQAVPARPHPLFFPPGLLPYLGVDLIFEEPPSSVSKLLLCLRSPTNPPALPEKIQTPKLPAHCYVVPITDSSRGSRHLSHLPSSVSLPVDCRFLRSVGSHCAGNPCMFLHPRASIPGGWSTPASLPSHILSSFQPPVQNLEALPLPASKRHGC